MEPIPECLSTWMGNLLYWVASTGGQFYAGVVAPLGVRPQHVAILQVLASEGPMVQARLTDRTRIDKASMVALLNDLESQGLIQRRLNPDDRRAYDIHLLETGGEKLREVERASIEADRLFFGVLSPEEQETLRQLLRRLATRTDALDGVMALSPQTTDQSEKEHR